jgi:hypothetical protein
MDDIRYWLGFSLAIDEIVQVRSISRNAAIRLLDAAIANGDLRTKIFRHEDEAPEIAVAGADFELWLDAKPSAGGKQSRVIACLAKLYPDGVPDRDVVPRTQLQADLLKLDTSLFPLTFKTLQKAIEAFNATRKR